MYVFVISEFVIARFTVALNCVLHFVISLRYWFYSRSQRLFRILRLYHTFATALRTLIDLMMERETVKNSKKNLRTPLEVGIRILCHACSLKTEETSKDKYCLICNFTKPQLHLIWEKAIAEAPLHPGG